MGFTIDVSYKGLDLQSRFPWKIGIVSFMAFPRMLQSKDEILPSVKKIAEDSFFDLIELPPIPSELWSDVRRTLGSKDFSVACQPMILSKLDLNSRETEKRRYAIDSIKAVIESGKGYGLKVIALCSGPRVGEGYEEAKELLVESLVELCSYASDFGIRIVLESFDTAHDKKLLTGPIGEAADVVRKVKKNCSNIGLMWDLSHAPLLGEKPEDIRIAADILTNIHIGCAKKTDRDLKDWHPAFYTKGALNSEDDVARLLSVLKDIGFRGPVSFEAKPEEYQTSEEVMHIVKGVLMKAYSQMISTALAV